MLRNWPYKLLALGLAFILWYFISGREKIDYRLEVPLEIESLPQNYVITNQLPSKIVIRIRATRIVLEKLQKGNYNYTLNLSKVKVGTNVIVLDSSEVHFPLPVEVVSFYPPRLEIDVDRLEQKIVPVKVVWQSEFKKFKDYFSEVRIQVNPKHLKLTGPAHLLKQIAEVKTKLIKVDPVKSQQWSGSVPLELLSEINADVGSVEVVLNFKPKFKDFWIIRSVECLAISDCKCEPMPAKIKLHLRVPLYLLRKNEWKKSLKVWVRVDRCASQELILPVQVTKNKRVLVLEKRPETVKLELKTKED